jgi:hypothetical protein
VKSTLFAVPIEHRRRLAATLGLFAALFVAVGAVSTTGRGGAVLLVFAGVAFLVALVLGLAAWGVAHSVKLELAAQHLDAAIGEVMARSGQSCGCGHEHDPSEMHVTDRPACGADAAAECEHNCDTCVLFDRAARG